MSASSYRSFAEMGDDNHVLIHVLPNESNSGPRSWHHYIQDLDDFFNKVYRYHQRSGFKCIVLSHISELLEILFIIFFTIFLFHGVNYDILFKNHPPPSNHTKVTIADALIPLSEAHYNAIEIFLLIFASLFCLLKLIRFVQSIIVNLSIKCFYTEALHVNDVSLFTWQEIQTKLIQAQHLCLIQDGQLNELIIHNRILRHNNYMIALINKGLLPIHYNVPFFGEITYLTKGLQFNMQLLLFKGPFSLFEHSWKLKDDVKISSQRHVCASQFAKNCLILAIINIILFPLIALWQLIYTFYMYFESIKRDPSMALGSRNWSLYGRWYCRHFNELDHQLTDRLNRGYKAANKYMNSFTSPLYEIIAKNISFVAGSILAVLICLTIYDEDVITVEHVFTLMTALGGIIAISRAFIASEIPSNYTHTELYTHVIEHIHYRPHYYAAYTHQARASMATVFQYKTIGIFEELLSPIITPYILLRHMRSRSQQYVDFFHSYTIDVTGIGDVCTFAMMNIKENGNPLWKIMSESRRKSLSTPKFPYSETSHLPQLTQQLITENGKLELSLINFKLANPKWNPYNDSQTNFIQDVTSNCIIQEEDEVKQQSSPLQSNVHFSPPPSVNASMRSEREMEKDVINRVKDRLLNDMRRFGSEHEERAAMSLSSLILHNHVMSQPSDVFLQPPHSEREPLLSSAQT